MNVRVIVVSVGRLIAIANAGSSLEEDLTWSTIDYIMWVQCESPVSLISICLPNMLQLIRHLRKRWRITNNNTPSQPRARKASTWRSNRPFRPLEDASDIIPMTSNVRCLKTENSGLVQRDDWV